MPVGHEALGHVGQHGIIAELVDVDAVTAAAIRVEAARVIAQVRRDVDKPIARLLDGSLGRGVVAVDLIVRGEVRPGIDRRDRCDIELCRRQLRLRIGKEAEIVLASAVYVPPLISNVYSRRLRMPTFPVATTMSFGSTS